MWETKTGEGRREESKLHVQEGRREADNGKDKIDVRKECRYTERELNFKAMSERKNAEKLFTPARIES